MSQIDDKYAALGGAASFLGKPTAAETTCPDGKGHYRHYEGGSIYWHSLTGAHEVHGLIRAKWAKLGWEKSVLGYPKTDEADSGGGAKGRFNLFQGGAMTWKQGAKEAFETHGAIRSKFGQMGWEAGFLGFPTTDETATPDGVGRFNHFDGGSVYWKPTLSAHEVHGLIHQYWAAHGWEKNPELGYPLSDELPTFAGSPHRFADFENGVLYWKAGAGTATPLGKFPVGSLTAAEIVAEIKDTIVTTIHKASSHAYIKTGPSLGGVSDYFWDGTRVRNRLYRIWLDVGIDVPNLPDATSNVGLRIEIGFDREAGTIAASLYDASFHTNVPFPTSVKLKADDINAQFKQALDPLVGVPQITKTVPGGMHLLSAKVMPNGDLNLYLQPPGDK